MNRKLLQLLVSRLNKTSQLTKSQVLFFDFPEILIPQINDELVKSHLGMAGFLIYTTYLEKKKG